MGGQKEPDKNRPTVLFVGSDVEKPHSPHVWFEGFNEGNNIFRCSCSVFATMQMFQLLGSKVRRVIVSSHQWFFVFFLCFFFIFCTWDTAK